MLKHKGYCSEPKYSSEDELFYGTIEGINDLVTFEAQNAHELKQELLRRLKIIWSLAKRWGNHPIRLTAETYAYAWANRCIKKQLWQPLKQESL